MEGGSKDVQFGTEKCVASLFRETCDLIKCHLDDCERVPPVSCFFVCSVVTPCLKKWIGNHDVPAAGVMA